MHLVGLTIETVVLSAGFFFQFTGILHVKLTSHFSVFIFTDPKLTLITKHHLFRLEGFYLKTFNLFVHSVPCNMFRPVIGRVFYKCKAYSNSSYCIWMISLKVVKHWPKHVGNNIVKILRKDLVQMYRDWVLLIIFINP